MVISIRLRFAEMSAAMVRTGKIRQYTLYGRHIPNYVTMKFKTYNMTDTSQS